LPFSFDFIYFISDYTARARFYITFVVLFNVIQNAAMSSLAACSAIACIYERVMSM